MHTSHTHLVGQEGIFPQLRNDRVLPWMRRRAIQSPRMKCINRYYKLKRKNKEGERRNRESFYCKDMNNIHEKPQMHIEQCQHLLLSPEDMHQQIELQHMPALSFMFFNMHSEPAYSLRPCLAY